MRTYGLLGTVVYRAIGIEAKA